LPPEPAVSVMLAAKSIFRTGRAWSVVAFLAVASVVTTAASILDYSAAGFPVSVFVIGLLVSVSRAVYSGEEALPSPLAGVGTTFRRGASALLVVLVPLLPVLLLEGAYVVWLALRFTTDTPLPRDAVMVPVRILILVVPAIAAAYCNVVLTVRYVVFDRISEGMRYREAWRVFRLHRSTGSSLVGLWLVGAFAVAGLQYAASWAAGFTSVESYYSAFTELSRGQTSRVLLMIAVYSAVAVLAVLWQLIIAHLLGQYARVVYGVDDAGGSV